VLAENGLVGFFALLYLLYFFAKTDIYLYKKLKGDSHSIFLTFSIISWLYVFANQFTPLSNSQPMVIFFWVFRGMIDRIYFDAMKHTQVNLLHSKLK
jgi:O-antigen ligase